MNDYLIAGGGLIGLLTAHYLAQAGAKVSLVERGQIGQESSWAGGGILSPLYPWKYPAAVNLLAGWSQAHYPQIARELQADTGIDAEWTQSGMLILDEDEISAASAWSEAHSARLQILPAGDIPGIEPALGAAGDSAIWLPDVAQIRNPRLVRALHYSLGKRDNVSLQENTEISCLIVKGEQVRGVKTRQGEITADRVIIACGAWSATLLKDLGQPLPVMPVRGQMILYRGQPGQLRRILLKKGHYAIPRLDGRILVGSTMEEVGFDKTVTPQARQALEAAARELVPMLADLPIERHWAGLRPGSPTGTPFIGPHPGLAGLYINTGHFRNGVVTAPASAKLLANMLLEQAQILDPKPFSLSGRLDAA